MSETFQELADIPKDFVREGSQFVRRCTKPDKREFIKISQAVGMGFLVMGAIGYFVKLSSCSIFTFLSTKCWLAAHKRATGPKRPRAYIPGGCVDRTGTARISLVIPSERAIVGAMCGRSVSAGWAIVVGGKEL
ncbi:hypothetical protein N7499_005235 [Penicillium canescens]|uniref:Uncharacterized protein n=1 Tax=Penicillium canescens TaxID=5083 RepID=A0AAD6N3J7_PENCN|nr:uncharacterized protein N7446_004268 [Penicillium canescens]KAJ6009356.1 hypothetical protein N7522_004372 [Penicillium canescens]KAJ6027132.1 hypothetical protein N7460_011949 [Penicillium canescens]KAJ6040415.1 hypothetical protein N7444_009320 [Penicillium canescens]KAJ6067231.1 hypothetical protein N7446_004268 [Penicillium canescens]KAJ6085606.1 hypothetical protein N7499_005235 [Penicillium canescens]